MAELWTNNMSKNTSSTVWMHSTVAAVVVPVTQSSSLSVEDHTVRFVVRSELTSMDYQMASGGIIMLDKLQLTVPLSVVWL